MARELVGKVVDLSERGLLVKATAKVPLGAPLVDVRNQPVGRVADVIGPVAAPYIIIQLPRGANANRMLSRDVYIP